jgi:hypothetical protein
MPGRGAQVKEARRVRRVKGIRCIDIQYVIFERTAQAEIWVDKDADKDKVQRELQKLARILDKYGFGDWSETLWEAYDIEPKTIRELVEVLQKKGYNVLYDEYLD